MIEIRLAAASDLDWLCAMEAECFSLPWTREQLERQLSGDGRLLYVAELDSNLAGYMGLDYVLDEGYVTNVCTAQGRRRGAYRRRRGALARAGIDVRHAGGARIQRRRAQPVRAKGLYRRRDPSGVLRKTPGGRRDHDTVFE